MAGKAFRLKWTATTSGGSYSESMSSWPQIVNGSCQINHLFIRSSQNITYDFKITSPSGAVIFSRKDIAQELNESPNMMMRGLYTFTIENASADDTISLEALVKDVKDR